LPYVIELLEDDEEVLIHLSETLGNLLDCVGGPSYAESILRVLEKLCAVEEISVREKVKTI
jgi:serine/threonine-protein phosphatase 2A regulatory subunit A